MDPEYATSHPWICGDVLEVGLRDDEGADQGSGVLLLLSQVDGRFLGKMLRVTDDYYKWWLTAGDGDNPGWYRAAQTSEEPPSESPGPLITNIH